MVNLRSHTTRLGVLDIGSNTIHMLIVDAAPGARPDPEASTKSHRLPRRSQRFDERSETFQPLGQGLT